MAEENGKGHNLIYSSTAALVLIIALVVLILANQFLVTGAFASASSSGSGTISLKEGFEYGPKTTLKPIPLPTGEAPKISGYKSVVKPLVTISELSMAPLTGDVVQDLVNNIIPKGTPWYGEEAGVTFDDPEPAATKWNKGRAIQLDADQQKRWERIVNSFTCDYCCGSPQNPTIITRCGCNHAQAAQGMAKWFIKNYNDRFSDEEIYGEMARWYAAWYPGPTVKRIVLELQSTN